MKFVHQFSRKLACELTVSDSPPAAGQSHVQKIEWVGKRERRHVDEYRRWTLATHQFLADHWNLSILYALGISPNCTELWQFTPREPPRLVQKLPIGIP